MKLPREKTPTSSADEDTIQEPRIKLPRETASVDLRNPETGIKGMNIPKQDIVICADIVKHGAEGQKCVLQNSLCLQQNCQNQKLLLQKLTKKKQFTKKVPYVCFDSSRAQSQITGYRDPQSRKVY